MYTIITVCFNAADDLEKTLLSVLAQKNCEIEYIIKDGASTDRTPKVVQKYEADLRKLKNFVFVSEKDNGIYDAMNIATKMARGDRLQFLNAGDCLIHENVIASVEAKECDADILYGSYTRIFTNCTSPVKAYKEDIPDFACKMNFSHQAAFIKRELMQEYLYDTNYSICADYEFFQKAYANGKTFCYVDEMVISFLMGGTSYQRAFDLLDETYDIQLKYGIITKQQWLILSSKNRMKRFSRKLLPKKMYEQMKIWKKNRNEKKWDTVE